MVVGVLCLIGLGFYEAYADLPLPIMPPKIFKKWRVRIPCTSCIRNIH
jgi:hypothetical protein